VTRRPRLVSGLLVALAVAVLLALAGGRSADAAPSAPENRQQHCTPGETKISGLIPDECYGDFPVSSYDISYQVGWSPTTWLDNVMGFLTKLSYNVGTWFIALAQWAVGQAFEFPIGEYSVAALQLNELYRVRLFGGELGVSLTTLVYTALFTYVAINILRNKASMALGELLTSVVLVTCAIFLVNNVDDYMRDTWKLMNSATAALLVAGNSESTVSPAVANETHIAGAVDEVQIRLHDLFIAEPYDVINWGGPLTGECARRRDDILRRETETRWYEDLAAFVGWGDEPYEVMGGPSYLVGLSDCQYQASFNRAPTPSRLGSAVLSGAASVTAGFVIGTMALTVVIAKFVVLCLFAVSPFLLLVALLPGSGRRWMWMWLTTLVQAIVVAVGLAFVLSAVLTIMRILLDATAAGPDGTGGRPLIERFALVLGLVMLMSTMRNRLLSGTQSTAGRFTDNLTNARLGGGGMAWQAPTGTTGTDLGSAATAIGQTARTATAGLAQAAVIGTAVVAGNVVAQRMRERRMWHNTVKARLLGDQLSAVSDRGYIGTDPVGSASGVMPRGGYPPGPSSPPNSGGGGVPPRPALPRGGGGGGGARTPTPTPAPRPGGGGGGRPSRAGATPPSNNLWDRAARAYENGNDTDGLYFQKMAQLHHNYQHQAGRTDKRGERAARQNYELQKTAVGEEYARSMGYPGPRVADPWSQRNLGAPRPAGVPKPIAAPGKSRRFNEVVRQNAIYPGMRWTWNKPWLWASLHRGNKLGRQAAGFAEREARKRGYDL